MKILFKVLIAVTFTTATTGCDDYLDINTNQNQPTLVQPDAILASALANTAGNYSGNATNYNTTTSFSAGYWGKSGVVNGFTEERTYTYTSLYYQNLWSQTYDNLNDYQLIQDQAATYPSHAAIARIMKVYNFQLLVDQYGDIPYTNALQGAANTTPTYDKADAIYKDFIVQLDGAIDDINKAATVSGSPVVGAEDIVFAGNMVKWKQFANSLKLRILLRQSQADPATVAYVRPLLTALQSASDGFITTDVMVQPGYAQAAGQQNPFFNRYGTTAAGTAPTERLYQLPTNYIIAQYVGNSDPRVSQLYTIGARGATGSSTPEYIGTDLGERSPPSFTAPVVASRFLSGGGLLKGFNAPTPIMLLSEHLFSKAEAEARSLLTGNAKQDYLDGMKASFLYFYRPASIDLRNATNAAAATVNAATATTAGITQYNTYINANPTNPRVNYDLAADKQEVIIFQKYLALNTVASTEAWADYRRTGKPAIPLSLEAATPNRAVRLLYPQSEVNTNNANIPTNVTQFTKIFWDVQD